ncbi:putative cytochrome P450 hydroxylase [Leucobacter sp. 7(1)]|uniref:cytochrome P450 n=1 Tax=Leucobacter sp. 7(1) TaxID=1255613 RepID=UPI00097F5C3F|nr:cytochrome P450 [Leucobacter sp. 7(1)]SJN10566.1 putative cytochrome P450 hydroxylase [Leucobacter sp. 7(1)]
MTGTNAPVADWVTIPELYRDPFPIYERLRAEGGVHWVPAVSRYLVTSYDAVHQTELDQEVFSANEEGSLQIRAMGHSMLRRDDPEHYIERKAWQPALRPGVVKRVWTDVFRNNATRYLDEFIAKGPGADLVWDFAAPYAAENLRQLVGLYNSSQEDLQRWSQTMIDATGNYADDPEVWRLGEQSYTEVDEALDDMLQWHAVNPDHSLISQLLRIPDYEMPLERIRANLKMTIGGGLNEPRDALGVTAWALLQDPEQLAAVRADPALWHAAFDESIRWIAPIGMYSRQTTREVELAGVTLPAGARLGICILSANRDTSVWDAPERFDLQREVKPHLAFGKGVHVCLGAWVARAEVADVALPALFARLDGLRLSASRPAEVGGWVFRGMTHMPVEWDRATTAGAGSGAAGSGAAGSGTAGSGADGSSAAEAIAQPRIAIVGSGPAGCFTAQAARRAFPGAPVDVFDELPTPYGLVRYGVAADHPGTKAVARQFDRLFAEPGVAFRGNLRLGRDVTLAGLRAEYDAVVLATGMREDAQLGIPGAELARGAGSVTRHLNAHPDEAAPEPLGATVAVIGHGNVALDIARLLSRNAAGLEGSDIDDAAHRRFAGEVRTVHLIGRSDPGAAKFDPVMVRELATLPGVAHVIHGAGPLPDDGRDARIDAVRSLADASLPGEGPRVRIEWWFGAVPQRIVAAGEASAGNGGPGAVEALDISVDGATVRLGVDDVISAIGFAPNTDTPLVPSTHDDGRAEAGLYVAGWLRRGPRGTIPDQRADARGLVQLLAEDLRSGAVEVRRAGLAPIPGEIGFDGWRRIDVRERLEAAPGRTRAKLSTREAMCATAADPNFDPLADVPAEQAPTGAETVAGAGLPVTILFATESGGAELVAEELSQVLPDAEVRDLADTHPAQLDPGRLTLLICATYGDGEVPTSARPFHAALAAGETRLDDLRYAVFGMGDRSYERTYSRGSELVDEALAACGAVRVGEFGRYDAAGPIPATEVAEEWAQGVLAEAAEIVAAAGAAAGAAGA